MLDRRRFKAALVLAGLTTRDMACAMGINEATLYRKLSGKSDFTRNEILVFRNLTQTDLTDIFFASELAHVQKEE